MANSVFKDLASELSFLEKKEMLAKIESSVQLSTEPIVILNEEDNRNIDLAKSYKEMSFLLRIYLKIRAFFSGKKIDELVERHLLGEIKKDIHRRIPGWIDFNKGVIFPQMTIRIFDLIQSLKIFEYPLSKCLDESRSGFFLFIGQIYFPEMEDQIMEKTDPWKAHELFPEKNPSAIRDYINQQLNDIVNRIPSDKRAGVLESLRQLKILQSLTSYPWPKYFSENKINLDLPHPLEDSVEMLNNLGKRILQLDFSPDNQIMQTLFLFYLQSFSNVENDLEVELSKLMSQANDFFVQLREFTAKVPLLNIMKLINNNVNYILPEFTGGEDWFNSFRKSWEQIVKKNYMKFYLDFETQKSRKLLMEIWHMEEEEVPEIPGFLGKLYLHGYNFTYQYSFPLFYYFSKEYFSLNLHYVLNIIMINGKFYKKNNRSEFEETFHSLCKTEQLFIEPFEKLRKEGEWFKKKLFIDASFGSNRELHKEKMFELLQIINREIQITEDKFMQLLQSMKRLIEGVVNGNGGPYDTLSNLADIYAMDSGSFKEKLLTAEIIINKTCANMVELISLEERSSD